MEPKVLRAVNEVCGVVAHDLRRGILWSLLDEPSDVGSLAAKHKCSITLASNSLRRLRLAGLVVMTPDARRRVYSVSDRVRAIRHKDERSMVLQIDGGAQLTISVPVAANPSPKRRSPSVQRRAVRPSRVAG